MSVASNLVTAAYTSGPVFERKLDSMNSSFTELEPGEVNPALALFYGAVLGSTLFGLWLQDKLPFLLCLILVGLISAAYAVAIMYDLPMYDLEIGDAEWNASLLKAILVIIFAALPVIIFHATSWPSGKWFGRYITVIYTLNILYTLLLDSTTEDNCSYLRMGGTVLLCCSLAIRAIKLEKSNVPLIFNLNGCRSVCTIYAPVTTLWALAYTLWDYSYASFNLGIKSAFHLLNAFIGVGYEMLKYHFDSSDVRIWLKGYKFMSTYGLVEPSASRAQFPENQLIESRPSLGQHYSYARVVTLAIHIAVDRAIGLVPVSQDYDTRTLITCDQDALFYHAWYLLAILLDFFWACLELTARDSDHRKEPNSQVPTVNVGDSGTYLA